MEQKFFEIKKKSREEFLVRKGLSMDATLEDAISDLLMKNGKVDCQDSKNFFAGIYSEPASNYQRYLRFKNDLNEPHADSHRFANHGKETSNLFNTLLKKAPRGIKIEGELKEKFNIKKRSITVLNSKQPSPTLTSHPDDYIHYAEPRILTVREYARVQSFPDWYKIRRKYTTGGKLRKKEVPRYTQLGNAIPPLFGEQAGLALRFIIQNGQR
jgi:DNA (cytosine-5)-methyltransferase 1